MVRRDLTFRVFVSSTFNDLKTERNALQYHVFPLLREYCRKRGARFQAIDLRWGVGEEAAFDQKAMQICLQELHRCQQLSPRPNFLILLGDRYGWRPLPSQVEASEFESLLAQMTNDERQHINQWYRRDDNAVSPEYCLLPRTGEFVNANCWTREEDTLRSIFVHAVEKTLAEDAPERQKYFDSATHQEIRHGVLQTENTQAHVFCYFREISKLPEDSSAGQYRDIRNDMVDQEAYNRLKNLKQQLGTLHGHSYVATWQGDHPAWNLNQFCADVLHDLEGVIAHEVADFRRQAEMDREIEAHRDFCEERSQHFIGRQDVLQRVHDYLESDDCTPLIIHGKAGSGKSALMAKAWLEIPKEQGAIIRFIGATPSSSDLRSLLTSLCRQMGVREVPVDMNDLVNTFRARLSTPGKRKNEPLVLFLDALDQLNQTDNAHMLKWLPRELGQNIKLVCSVLETDNTDTEPINRSEDSFINARRIWPGQLVQVGALDMEDGSKLLDVWLTDAHRLLQPEQRADLLNKFKACPLPLYLKLAFEEARNLKSWEGLLFSVVNIPSLSNTVEDILDNLFSRLELPRYHGHHLVKSALSYLAASKNGLTEDELLDVLSADADVMAYFYEQSPTEREKPTVERLKSLPVVIWSRLFADISPYMTLRRADGTVVMDFYHRQIKEAVRRRYLATEHALVQAHLHLADYFLTLDYWAESLDDQRTRACRLPPSPRLANVRKVVELPFHRLEVAKLAGKHETASPYWDAVADLLTDWQFLEAKAEANPNYRDQEFAESSSVSEETEQ